MTAARHSFEEPSAVSWQRELAAAGLQALQQERAVLAAEEAEYILELAELCPVDDDPPPEHPGAKKRRGWSPHEDRPGVSEFFLDELAMVLNVGRGTAAFRARRAFCWRDKLPATFAALQRGEIDERRAQEVFLVLEHVETKPARRVDAALIGQATDLSVRRLGERARELLLEYDAAAAEERRKQVADGADVFVQSTGDGLATLGAEGRVRSSV
jgi:hypothetical protein